MNEAIGEYYVDGRWVSPRSSVRKAVVNPADEKNLGHIYLATAEDVADAVKVAHGAFPEYSTTSKYERLKWLDNLLQLLEDRREDMARAISLEMGAPIQLARHAQANSGIGHTQQFIKALRSQKDRDLLPNDDHLVHEPVGVCGLITPWNWPLNQITLKVIPALAAGCSCVLKPSEYTPLSATLFASLIDQAGFPKGVFNMIHGDGELAGRTLVQSPLVDMVSFTGSIQAGRQVYRDATETIKKVTLELGGKSPNIVFADCNLTDRVTMSVKNCFQNSGQSCNAPTRMLVERRCLDQVLTIATKVASDHCCGQPNQEGTHLGPLVNKNQYERVQKSMQRAIDQGAKLLCGGPGRPDELDRGYFVKPTVFFCDNDEYDIVHEDVFGPVLVICGFNTEDEAVEMANNSPYGLAAHIQTRSVERGERVAARLRVGAIHINGGELQYGSPYGGYKQSGNGREGGIHGLNEFQELKTIHYAEVA
ncbi:MAG: aldehyde dehydrogenase family protein [Pseudomonadota bacterium]